LGPDLSSFYDQPPGGILEIKACIDAIENSSLLYEKENFDSRVEAIDFIDFFIIDQIELLLHKANQNSELISLKYLAEQAKNKLEAVNAALFLELRNYIQNKKYTGLEFSNIVHRYVNFVVNACGQQEAIGYDTLDIFINGLLSFHDIPDTTKDLEPEMVFYQKTPARIIFGLVDKFSLTKEDVFFDLGSGLGQVTILVNLLTGATTKGVEFEPAFCEYATACAEQLNLSNVAFVNDDARNADYSKGTVFFMYTPFNGEMLQEVLEALQQEAQKREIRIFTYGPCTSHLASQDWLNFEGTDKHDIYALSIFSSNMHQR